MRSLISMNIFLGQAYAPAPNGVTAQKPPFESFLVAKDAKVEEFGV